MAYVIRSVKRAEFKDEDAGGWSERDELIVDFFRTEDGATARATFKEADHTGLIAEFEAGTATTVLDAACDDWVANVGVEDDPLSTAQKTWKDAYTEEVP